MPFLPSRYLFSPHVRAAALLALALSLPGCADMSDSMSLAFADPAKYDLYDCKQLEPERKRLAARSAELQGLMAKAGQDTSGRFVGTIAYRPEYLQLRGQMNEIRRTSTERKCQFDPETPPGGSGSDEVIR